MNILGKRNQSSPKYDFKNKKENNIHINNADLGAIIAQLMKEVIEISSILKNIDSSLKHALIKIENLERRVEKLENGSKLHN